jgi:putative DNA primase/helicase
VASTKRQGFPVVPDAIDPSAFVAAATAQKPHLKIHNGDLPATVYALRDLLAASGTLFDRGGPVHVGKSIGSDLPIVVPLTKHSVVMEAHRLCQPVKMNTDNETIAVTLPDRVAQMYLDMSPHWDLPPLAGVCTAPLLSSDGTIRTKEGYDPERQLWCANALPLDIPSQPTREDAAEALERLRLNFRTFPFKDSVRCRENAITVVDLNHPPKHDESAFLVALMTAVCRPSLWLAPGFLVTAPSVSGAGSGKGKLVRATCIIAFGLQPRAFTTGTERHELDKRLAAELIEAQPAVFIDNVNGIAMRSDTLASVLTERPTRVRLLGQTRMVPLNSTAFIAVTGNGLTVTEDLARRFIYCELDARCEDPELRPFAAGFLDTISSRRAELLALVLTIWRWGRQNADELDRGRPLGSFEQWAEWCRDPLLTLGCLDPVERIETLKSNDPRRQRIGELFNTWWTHHRSEPVAANNLAPHVKAILDPQSRGRQYLAAAVMSYAGTRAAGFVLSRQKPAGKWAAATYALTNESPDENSEHMAHGAHGPNGAPPNASPPTVPKGPMPDGMEDYGNVQVMLNQFALRSHRA